MGAIDSAITKLRDLIASGELSPGDRLPPEPELAGLVGVSRNTLREAVRALIQANVLDVRRGDGTYVTSLEPRLLLSGLSFVVDLMQDRTLLELVEVRRILEPAATALAAERITDETLEEVRRSLERMKAARSTEELVAEDMEFHRLVVGATGNATLESFLDALVTSTTKARVWRAISGGGVKAWTLNQHDVILEALAAHDARLASAASTVLVAASETWVRQLVAKTASHPESVPLGRSTDELAQQLRGVKAPQESDRRSSAAGEPAVKQAARRTRKREAIP